MNRALAVTPFAAVALAASLPSEAEACGCFAPPDPTVPIVQAGERIVFAQDGNQVVAHIQIQAQGDAGEFGWLLPLPSVPEMQLGTEELFALIQQTTQPRYRLTRVGDDNCLFPLGGGIGRGSPSAGFENNDGSMGPSDSPLVLEDSIGPYDFAVLKADRRDEMLAWLAENRYFIPTGTEDVVGPYIRPGAYFLALKLRKGNDLADIQPVVLRYTSDLPMIPIILTSVAATPDMGVQVWVLGEHRAIPRNYHHTVLNEEHINWFDAGSNYPELVVAATNEAPDGQSFITEYAGPTTPMLDRLDWSGRFGDRVSLAQAEDVYALAQDLSGRGFPDASSFRNLLAKYYPYPARLESEGVLEEDFYRNVGYWLGYFRDQRPELFEGYAPEFEPEALVDELWERIVVPTLDAGALFRHHSKMTRMLTTLSPEEMTRDPVFSFNPDLPDVSQEHQATFTYQCGGFQDGPGNTPGVLELADGRRIYVMQPDTYSGRAPERAPYSRRIETLREEGPAVVEIDNEDLMPLDSSGGCTCAAPRTHPSLGLLLGMVGVALFGYRRRR